MLLTVWCIAVIFISLFAIGIPVCWLIGGRKPLDQIAWIQVPFLGIAAIILILQNLVYFDLPVRYTTPFLWAATLAAWVWIARSGVIRASIATIPRALFGVALAVYLLQGLGLLIIGAKFYLGRAWVDQYNYTILAQFLADQRFSTAIPQIGHQPYMITAIVLKTDRIGEGVLQAFFASSSLQDTKTLFEATILLCPALTVLAIFGLARRFGLGQRYALVVAAAAGLLPSIAALHLESFLSHALAMPLLLFYPLLLDRLVEQINWQRLAICAIIAAALTSIYTEFWVLLMGLIVLILGVAAVRAARPWRLLGCWFALTLAPFALNPFFTSGILTIFTRVDEPVLGSLYPWALTIGGICRIWLGDLAGIPTILQSAIRLYALAATMLAYYGLMQVCLARLAAGRATWADAEQRRTLAFALGVLTLALLPIVIIARDSLHAYQFYKLLISISPLFVLGFALAFQPAVIAIPAVLAAHAPQPRTSIYAALASSLILIGSMAGTIYMTAQTASSQPFERYNGYALIDPDMRQLEEQLEALHDRKLFIYQPDLTMSVGYLNAWLAYFARNNQLWLGNPRLNGVNLSTNPAIMPINDLSTLPPDALVLSRIDSELAAFVPKQAQPPLWGNASYQLWQPTDPYWLIPLKVENKNGLEQVNGESFLWMGQGDTTVQVLASKAGMLSLNATFSMGPSVADPIQRTLLITTTAGYIQQETITKDSKSILVPVKAGVNTITLRVLDQPDIKQQPNGDMRPLLLAVKGLTLRLSQVAALIEGIENLNGVELVNQQPFFWLGQGDTTVKVRTTAAGQLQMTATFLIGPSAPELSDRRVLLTTDHGFKQTFILAAGKQSIALPVEAGATSVTLHMLDQPSVLKQPNGDARPLLLGVQGLQVELAK